MTIDDDELLLDDEPQPDDELPQLIELTPSLAAKLDRIRELRAKIRAAREAS